MQTKSTNEAPGMVGAGSLDMLPESMIRADAPLSVTTAPGEIRRRCDACDDDQAETGCTACLDETETDTVQPKSTGQIGAAGGDAPDVVESVLQSPGEPLHPGTRSFFEERFGYDFGTVRVHTDTAAGQSATAIGAHAYTLGSNIVFANGRFDPSSQSGRELLAHELTHVVQQGGQPKAVSRDSNGAAPSQQPGTPSGGVRALASRFEMYATQGEAALARAPISMGDANHIRSNMAKLRTAIAGMRTIADKGEDNLCLALLANFTTARLESAAARLHRATPGKPAITVAETAPQQVAAFKLGGGGDNTIEREARHIAGIIASVNPASVRSSGALIMREPALEIVQQIEQEAPVIDELIDVSALGLGLGVAANDTVALGIVAATLASPVVVVGAVVVVAVLAIAAIWYFADDGLSEEAKKVQDVPPQTGYPAPAPGVTPPSPPPPVAARPGKDRWKTTLNPATGGFYSSEAEYNRAPRYATQTCLNSRLDEMESEMHRICDESGKWSCSDDLERIGKKSEKLLDCPELLKRIKIGEECVKSQLDLQAECFGGKPDPKHTIKISAYQAVLNICKQKLASRFPGGCP